MHFFLVNADPIAHEFVLGSAEVRQEHERMRTSGQKMMHGMGMVAVQADESSDIHVLAAGHGLVWMPRRRSLHPRHAGNGDGHVSDQTFLFADLAGFTALTEAHGDLDAPDVAERFTKLACATLDADSRLVNDR